VPLEQTPANGGGPAQGAAPRPEKGSVSLRVIGLFKLTQALLLAALALAALHLIRPTVAARVREWVGDLPYAAQEDLARRAVSWLLGLPSGHAKTLAGGTLLYALLFAVEGMGLLWKRRWAEWLTVVATASFIPLEVWEVSHRPGVIKVLVLLVNVAVVWFLVRHLGSRPPEDPS
jgi:uncharacterized membrane protein (DUF2068 family)